MQDILDIRVLAALEPISSFGPARLRELLEYCHLETLQQGVDAFREHSFKGQSVYLVRGELEVIYADSNRVLIQADSEWARHPIGKRQPEICSATAITSIQLLRVDDELLDQLVTWNQFSNQDEAKTSVPKERAEAEVRRFLNSGMFSAENLSSSPFAYLPSANIGLLLSNIEAIAVWDKEVIIHEGDQGDYYYLIESGRAQVSRMIGGRVTVLANLKAGDVFGEEALISNALRNASVEMKCNGVLLRLKKEVFLELMHEPLLNKVSYPVALEKVAGGAVWLDVRNPAEYRHDKLPDAINVPLHEVRSMVGTLSKDTYYVAYCQSGRRSAAAAFILVQAGYKVDVLGDGLWSIPVPQQH